MDLVRSRPGSLVSGRLLTAGAGGGMAGTSPQGRARMSIAEDPGRRRDDRRHAIAMKRTHPRQPAGWRSLTARKHNALLRLHGL